MHKQKPTKNNKGNDFLRAQFEICWSLKFCFLKKNFERNCYFEQLKLLSEKHCHLRDAIPYHWSLWFMVSPCYLQNAMPCQWSSSHLECYGFERAFFYSQVFFTLHSPAGFKDSLGAGNSTSRSAGFHAHLRNIAPAWLFV